MNDFKTEYNNNPNTTLKTDIKDLPNPAEILATVADIKKDSKIMNKKELDTKYEDFKNKYNHIYKLALTNDDLSTLYDMLKLIQQVKMKNVSIDNANKLVGQTMAKKYIPEHILNDKKSDD